MILSILFDVIQLWAAEPNWALTGIGVITLAISLLGIVVAILDGDDPPELRWAAFYTFPMALLVLASVVGRDELVNQKLSEHNLGFTVPQVFPGVRQDYIDAFWTHLASLSIPLMTVVAGLLITWGAQWWRARNSKAAP